MLPSIKKKLNFNLNTDKYHTCPRNQQNVSKLVQPTVSRALLLGTLRPPIPSTPLWTTNNIIHNPITISGLKIKDKKLHNTMYVFSAIIA